MKQDLNTQFWNELEDLAVKAGNARDLEDRLAGRAVESLSSSPVVNETTGAEED